MLREVDKEDDQKRTVELRSDLKNAQGSRQGGRPKTDGGTANK